MQGILKVILSIFLLTILILQPSGTIQADTSGKITSHPGVVVEYNISGGTITKKTATDNPHWGEQLEGTVRVGETLTVSVTGSTKGIKVEGIESDPRDSNFYYWSRYNEGIEISKKECDFPPVGNCSHTSSVTVTENMRQVNFTCNVTINSFASGQVHAQAVRFYASFDVVKDSPKDIPVEKVTITNCPGSIELLVGTAAKLNAAVSPDNATNKKVNWSVDNPAVASISSDGTLATKAPGTVTVTATSAENTQIKGQCKIKVSGEIDVGPDKPKPDPDPPKPDPDPPKPAPEITLTITNCPGQLGVGSKGQIKVAANPPKDSQGKDWRIGWFVDNNSVLTVDDSGRYVARKPGQVTITAYLYDRPMVQAICRVVVGKEQVAPKPPAQDPPKADSADDDKPWWDPSGWGQDKADTTPLPPKPPTHEPPPPKPPDQDPPKTTDSDPTTQPPPPPTDTPKSEAPDQDSNDSGRRRGQPPRHQPPPGTWLFGGHILGINDAAEPESDYAGDDNATRAIDRIFTPLEMQKMREGYEQQRPPWWDKPWNELKEDLGDLLPGKSLFDWLDNELQPPPEAPPRSSAEGLIDFLTAIGKELSGAKGWILERLNAVIPDPGVGRRDVPPGIPAEPIERGPIDMPYDIYK
jgi:uncharacterized protein YjdB